MELAVDSLQANQANALWFILSFASLLFLTFFFRSLGTVSVYGGDIPTDGENAAERGKQTNSSLALQC